MRKPLSKNTTPTTCSLLTKHSFRNDYLSQPVLGSYTYKRTCMLVNFRWLILPAALYLIITIFFIVTVFMTRNVPMWKSSPLPLLYSMNSEVNSGLEFNIKKKAKENWMQLRRTTTGWQVTGTTDLRKTGGRLAVSKSIKRGSK